MSHLDLETLARLIDEPATAAEAAHLEVCAECRRELDAMRDDVAALKELPDLLPPPPRAWPALEARLRNEGLIREPGRELAGGARFRLAASVALLILGGMSGFALRGWLGDTPAAPIRSGPMATAATGAVASPPATAEEAERVLREAEAAYLAALARYAEFAPAGRASDPVARLAALEDILFTTREALDAAPADPIINGYHLSALAQREATVRQIALTPGDRWY
jgi:hypothetical protein